MTLIRGLIDDVTADQVVGWAALEGHGEPLRVSLLVDGEAVASTQAAELRPLTRSEGWHPTGRCGFRFGLGAAEAIRPGSVVRVLAGEEEVELQRSPWTYRPPAAAPAPGEGARRKLFFMHIPKTAGSSLNALVAERYEASRARTHIETAGWARSPELADSHDFLSGHVRIGQVAAQHDLGEFTLVTLVREPHAQFASHLCWVRSVADDEEAAFFRQHPEQIRAIARRLQGVDFADPAALAAYLGDLSAGELALFDNCQTRYFLGGPLTGPVGEAHWPQVTATLDLLDLAGPVEDYDRFVATLRSLMGWPPAEAGVRLNVQPERYGLEIEDPEVRCAVAPLVRLDRRLHDLVTTRFAEVRERAAPCPGRS